MSESDQVAKRPKMEGGSENESQRKSTSPKKTCDLTTHKFAEIVGLAAFVDKTLFIKTFLQWSQTIIATLAPRGFGKSTNMDMIREFLSGNKKLFQDNKLKIYEEERDFFIENCKENPVIYVDFKSVGGETEDSVLTSLKTAIQNAYDNNKYLVTKVGENWAWSDEKLENSRLTIKKFVEYWKKPENISKVDIIYGLKILSECLYLYHGKRVYVLIDEYDAPVINAIMQTNPEDGVVKDTMNLISVMMSDLLKGNGEYVKRGLLNGRLHIGARTSADANNISYYEFLEEPKFAPYFGFTDREVKDLFERDEFATLKNDEIQKWYNGYRMMHTNECVIYNNYSILEYLQKSRRMDKPQFDTYWVNSGDMKNMEELFTKADIRNLIEDLINNEKIEINIIQRMFKEEILTLKSLIHLQSSYVNTNLFLNFLSVNGYLNIKPIRYDRGTVSVPNEEIKKLFREKCYNAKLFEQKYQLRSEKIHCYVEALCLLLQQKDRDAFIRFASAVSELFDGAVIPNNGYELHSILFTLAYNFRQYQAQNELNVQRIKRGRPRHHDMFVVDDDVGMIVELKFKEQSSEMAHTQILKQGYATAFNDNRNVTVKILLGLHMNEDRKVSLTYTVDDSAKQTVTSND